MMTPARSKPTIENLARSLAAKDVELRTSRSRLFRAKCSERYDSEEVGGGRGRIPGRERCRELPDLTPDEICDGCARFVAEVPVLKALSREHRLLLEKLVRRCA
jgi:hypothetical protein